MKIIKIKEDHYVVVDDSEIKEGDYFYSIRNLTEKAIINYPSGEHIGKITHSTQPLASMKELMEKGYDNILPLDIDEVKELIGEVDVEKKVKEYYEKDTTLNNPSSFKAGYNQALKDNKEKKYTEEDLVKAYEYGSNALLGISKINLIQSLQPKTEWKYVGECKGNNGNGCFMDSPGHDCGCYKRVPKTGWEVQLVDGKLKLK